MDPASRYSSQNITAQLSEKNVNIKEPFWVVVISYFNSRARELVLIKNSQLF